ncbi:hypothetical protein ACFT30_13675 [Microbacterium ureisolvens]|uniref:hypothetical protein n=1 Tax=Microbacterium ureisolvens TaxID=2781186 RepID=UPI00362DA7CB
MALKPGYVRDAIIAFLKSKGTDGAKIDEIYEAVSKALGQDVPKSSVRSYLNGNTPSQFDRLGRGTYRLRA